MLWRKSLLRYFGYSYWLCGIDRRYQRVVISGGHRVNIASFSYGTHFPQSGPSYAYRSRMLARARNEIKILYQGNSACPIVSSNFPEQETVVYGGRG